MRDRHLFVIDKPAGLVVHPGAGNRAHTLQNALLALDPKLAVVPRAGIVHRIDKDTSGLLVVARTIEAHTVLVEALREHEVQREYLALCVGAVTGGGTVDKPIGRHRTDRLRMTVRADGRRSRHALPARRALRAAHPAAGDRSRPAARTRSACTWRTSAIRWWAIRCMAVAGSSPPGATPGATRGSEVLRPPGAARRELAFEHPVTGKQVDGRVRAARRLLERCWPGCASHEPA